ATDTATAAAGSGLEHHRVADAFTFAQGLIDVGDVALGAGRAGHAGGDHAAPRFGLVAHTANDLGAGTDEFDAALGADFRQLGVFREEAITGVQGVAAGFHRQVDQLARVQITGQWVVTDAVRLVGALDVQSLAVRFGIHSHRTDAHLGTGAHDTHGNLAAVGDEDLLDHEPGSSLM